MKILAVLAVLATTALPAIAADGQQVDFHAKILNVDGSEVQVGPTDKTPLTLGKMSEDALIANNLPGDNPSTSEKGDRFRLALKIHAAKEALTSDEVVLLKKVIGMAYGPLPVGRALELLPK
jgi:hypothetical protein